MTARKPGRGWSAILQATRRAGLALAALGAGLAPDARAQAPEPIRLAVIGGLAGVSQFKQHEEPFWTSRIAALSGGRVTATIKPYDRSGLRGQDMLQLIRLGVVPFGTAPLSMVASDEPELNAVDLPLVSPTLADLKAAVAAYRPHLAKILDERFDVELLGIYAYPAQVLYCAKPFAGLSDVAGRRVRTSSVGQSELVSALGGLPVQLPFAEMVAAVGKGVVDCAVTGTLSGHEIGLSEVTTHVHTMALNWGLSIFGANQAAWSALPGDVRDVIRRGVADLEERIFEAAGRETERGLACNAGTAACGERRGRMTLVAATAADEERRRSLLTEAVLRGWVERCGPDCVGAWNRHLAGPTGVRLAAD